jgi:hypothetical protein
VAAVQIPGQFWPIGNKGLCGDKASAKPQDQKYLAAGPVAATYTSGQVIDIDLSISAYHKGRVSFSICNSATLSESCFNIHLTRADSLQPGSRYLYLPTTSTAAVTVGPNLTSNPGAGQKYSMRFKLPDGFTCTRCVLRWYYLTGNSCHPPCDPADPAPCVPDSANLGICGKSGTHYPEEFWNCADITVTGSGGSAATQCPPAPAGYFLDIGKDHGGNDIGSCVRTDISNNPTDNLNIAMNGCNANPACKAFNLVFGVNGGRCLKTVAGPLFDSPGICFYTKQKPTGGFSLVVQPACFEAPSLLPLH